MSHKSSMKPGFVQFVYMPPPDIKAPLEILKWQLNELAAMGGKVLNGGFGFPEAPAEREEIKNILTGKNLEFEFYAMGWMDLTGPNAKQAREALLKSIQLSKDFNSKILRSAYNGRLEYEHSRFNKAIPIKEHMKRVADNLKEAAKIFEDEGVYLAVENHCDFSGKEYAEIFSSVNSKHIGCGLDTGNSYTVYCEPNDDVDYLAEFTFSCHIKDMAMMHFKNDADLIPYQARGVALGDGNVDIPRTIDVLDKKSPFAEGLRLIIEQGWMHIPEGENPREYNAKCLKKGMKYLKSLLGQ